MVWLNRLVYVFCSLKVWGVNTELLPMYYGHFLETLHHWSWHPTQHISGKSQTGRAEGSSSYRVEWLMRPGDEPAKVIQRICLFKCNSNYVRRKRMEPFRGQDVGEQSHIVCLKHLRRTLKETDRLFSAPWANSSILVSSYLKYRGFKVEGRVTPDLASGQLRQIKYEKRGCRTFTAIFNRVRQSSPLTSPIMRRIGGDRGWRIFSLLHHKS